MATSIFACSAASKTVGLRSGAVSGSRRALENSATQSSVLGRKIVNPAAKSVRSSPSQSLICEAVVSATSILASFWKALCMSRCVFGLWCRTVCGLRSNLSAGRFALRLRLGINYGQFGVGMRLYS
jgi:hypothetical protein